MNGTFGFGKGDETGRSKQRMVCILRCLGRREGYRMSGCHCKDGIRIRNSSSSEHLQDISSMLVWVRKTEIQKNWKYEDQGLQKPGFVCLLYHLPSLSWF